jgi:hypothetical protein
MALRGTAPGKADWNRMLQNFDGNALYPSVAGPGRWQVSA